MLHTIKTLIYYFYFYFSCLSLLLWGTCIFMIFMACDKFNNIPAVYLLIYIHMSVKLSVSTVWEFKDNETFYTSTFNFNLIIAKVWM